MKCKRTGLTLVELLVVLGIIALLVGMLLPAMTVVQRTAKETKQRAQFSAIDLALTAFKNDFGDYPPSDNYIRYCGAQKLAEALLGWDLLGFHPNSDFMSNGRNDQNVFVYDTNDPVLFDQRKGPYLELASDNVFKLGGSGLPSGEQGLYVGTPTLDGNTYVICDVFGNQKIRLKNGRTVSAGSPILYYRANTSEKTIRGIYNHLDNYYIIYAKEVADGRGDDRHPLGLDDNDNQFFYDYIRDPKIEARAWPYRPDSYILISAGADGIYGTSDDIRNFGN